MTINYVPLDNIPRTDLTCVTKRRTGYFQYIHKSEFISTKFYI